LQRLCLCHLRCLQNYLGWLKEAIFHAQLLRYYLVGVHQYSCRYFICDSQLADVESFSSHRQNCDQMSHVLCSVCLFGTLASPAKTAEPIEMRRAYTCVLNQLCTRWGSKLAPPGEYSKMILAAAARRADATITIAKCLILIHIHVIKTNTNHLRHWLVVLPLWTYTLCAAVWRVNSNF